jgi:hypothetical protein
MQLWQSALQTDHMSRFLSLGGPQSIGAPNPVAPFRIRHVPCEGQPWALRSQNGHLSGYFEHDNLSCHSHGNTVSPMP